MRTVLVIQSNWPQYDLDALACVRYLRHAGYDVLTTLDVRPDVVFEFSRQKLNPQVEQFYLTTKLLRNIIVTDPTQYPLNALIVPNAVLSQETRTFDVLLTNPNRRWARIHAVYAGCENWRYWDMEEVSDSSEKRFQFGIGYRSHIYSQDQNSIERKILWNGLLSQCFYSEQPIWVMGSDWYDFPEVSIRQDVQLLSQTIGGPIVAERWGFAMPEPRLYALCNCCPYLFDNDHHYRYCYDKDERVLKFNSPARWHWSESMPTCALLPDDYRQTVIHNVLRATVPDFSALHALIERRGENSSGRYGGCKCL